MRYLTLAEAVIIAEAVTGIDAVAGELDETAVARWLGGHLARNA